MAHQPNTTLPATTEAHRRAAFAAMAWVGWSYEQAMADPTRSHLVQLRARQMSQAKTKAQRRVVVPGRYRQAFLNDVKRAAAGDCDD